MNNKTAYTLYRNSIVLITFLIPSAFYGLILPALGVTFICWLYFKDYKKIKAWFAKPQILWPSLLYLMVIGGLFFANDVNESVSTLSTKLPFFVFPLIIGTSSVVNKILIDTIVKWFVWSVAVFLAIAIGYAVFDVATTKETSILLGQSVYNKFSSYGLTRVFPNWHPTYVAMFVNFAIAILVQKYLAQFKKTKQVSLIVGLCLLTFLVVCLFLLNSIIALVVLGILLLYFGMTILSRLGFNIWAKCILIILLSAAAVSFFYFNPFKIEKIEALKARGLTVTDKEGERNVLTIRLAKWDTHLHIIKKYWLLGTTEGDIKKIRYAAYIKNGYPNLATINYNAHNEYIEVFATYGLLGFCIFICMLAFPLQQRNRHPYLVPFLIISSITFLTETVLNRQQGILAFMFLYALLTHPFSLKENKNET